MPYNTAVITSGTKNKKVAIGLSGGVDSSVSAYLLKEQGYDVVGVYMHCWNPDEPGCTSSEDKKYAIETAAKLGIKIEILDFIKEYKDKVISYFYDEYSKGRTPNPDVMCNKEIKFGMFFDWAMARGFDYVATGHYARITNNGNTYSLLKGVDPLKDQSYFLYRLNQDQLAKILFPVGGMLKTEIRRIAEEIHLPTAKRPDSTGICFIGEVDIKEFLKKQIASKTGNVVLKTGEVIGTHEGAWYYTIGQRRGFNVTKYQGTPLYIISKNVEKNELVVGVEEDLYVKEFEVEDIHWTDGKTRNIDSKEGTFKCGVRIRHLGEVFDAYVDLPKITLDKAAFGIAPGQSAVFYDGDVLLGGAIIK